MPGSGHNKPPVLVALTPELAEFVIKNCESNIRFAMNTIQLVERSTGEKMVELIEQFKLLKKAVEDAQRE